MNTLNNSIQNLSLLKKADPRLALAAKLVGKYSDKRLVVNVGKAETVKNKKDGSVKKVKIGTFAGVKGGGNSFGDKYVAKLVEKISKKSEYPSDVKYDEKKGELYFDPAKKETETTSTEKAPASDK